MALVDLEPFELALATAYLKRPCNLKKLWGIFRKFHFDSLDFVEAISVMEEEGFAKEHAEELRVSRKGRGKGYLILKRYIELQGMINKPPQYFGPADDYFGEFY